MDVARIKKLALLEQQTFKGKLQGWWWGKYGGKVGAPFEKRTMGGLLREYFCEAAIDLSRLRAQLRTDGHDADVEERIRDLEELFSDSTTRLQSLTDEESLVEWEKSRRTGDPKVDEWEAAIARGEAPDLED
ncbi:MAG: hypothetical protein KJN79_09285 [Gammaproteobacteria bacterium]|nr:hypothetical protein [Gammaproteobacteria bacterium]